MKIGFIGAGNMASALAGGMLAAKVVSAENLCLSDMDGEKLAQWIEKGVKTDSDNLRTAEWADVLFLAVKPHIIPAVLKEVKGQNCIFVSIAAGVSLSFLEIGLGSDAKIVRTMPNTPAQVNCGMTIVTPNGNLTQEERALVRSLLSAVGETVELSESYIDPATALHGSSPAYVYMFIDALADAGVKYGIPKATALRLAAKAVEGSAKMVLETGVHPEQLKDNVCSPGGTTIAAVCELEKQGFRHAVQQAVVECVERTREISQ